MLRVRNFVITVVITIVLFEAAIHVLFKGLFGQERVFRVPDVSSNQHRVVFLGDSNTYGLFYDSIDSYPAVLQALLKSNSPESAVKILNFAIPGNTSFAVLDNLDELMAVAQPDEVFLMIGSNDSWVTWREPVEETEVDLKPGLDLKEYSDFQVLSGFGQFLSKSAVVKLLGYFNPVLLSKSHGWKYGDKQLVVFDSRVGPKKFFLKENIARIKEKLQIKGIKLTLLTYPSSHLFYGRANKNLRMIATKEQIKLIDINKLLFEKCSDNCDPYFVYGTRLGTFPMSPFSGDQHPSRDGYKLIAEIILEDWGMTNAFKMSSSDQGP